MKKSALRRFQIEFCRWVNAHNATKGFETDPDLLLKTLSTKIPDERQGQIGAALVNGWIETEREPGRGYFVREKDRPGLRGGQFTITHIGGGEVAPCWELFVQLADYGWLRSVAERYRQEVRLEDRLMDLTVSVGDQLILYVEQKTKSSDAENLLNRIRYYGKQGFSLDDPDKGNDPLRKAKYMVREGAFPLFLGISAIGYRRLFAIEYLEGNRFQLIEENRGFSAVLFDHQNLESSSSRSWSPIDPLASEIERLCPELWVSVGGGKTAFNFYIPSTSGDAIIIGVYESGEVWTDIAGLGEARAKMLASELAQIGVHLDVEKQWGFWRKGNSKFDLNSADPLEIAAAVASVLAAT